MDWTDIEEYADRRGKKPKISDYDAIAGFKIGKKKREFPAQVRDDFMMPEKIEYGNFYPERLAKQVIKEKAKEKGSLVEW